MSIDLYSNQVVIVTGASSGIGAATAINLAKKGAVVVLNGRNESRLNDVKHLIGESNGKCITVVGDLTSQTFISELIKTTVAKYARIDALINSAGGGSKREQIENLSDTDWEFNLSNNLTSIFKICREITPQMKKQQYGRIVNVSSVAGRTSSYLAGHGYSAAKSGLQGFTRHLALELGPFGINVNSVAPGITKTDRVVNKWQALKESEQKRITNSIALRRLATPTEVANAISFLASKDASYITGTTLDVNGGIFMS